jgi:hypothetical protein
MGEKIIMYDDPSIIRKVDMVDETGKVISVGYLSNDNLFYNDADMARYRSCTHKTCECGKPMKKFYLRCDECRAKATIGRYNDLPYEEWNGVTPLATYDGDEYFFDIDDIEWFCEEHEMEPHELRLVICEPNRFRLVTSDYWDDIWPENLEHLPKEIEDALETFNTVLKNANPLSWQQGKTRTSIVLDKF